MPAAATRTHNAIRRPEPEFQSLPSRRGCFTLIMITTDSYRVPHRWVEGTGHCRKGVGGMGRRQSLPLTSHDQSISWDRPQNPLPCYSSNICKPLGPASQTAAVCSGGSDDGQHVWCFACLQKFWLDKRQAPTAIWGVEGCQRTRQSPWLAASGI
jgi:hypothetical protein